MDYAFVQASTVLPRGTKLNLGALWYQTDLCRDMIFDGTAWKPYRNYMQGLLVNRPAAQDGLTYVAADNGTTYLAVGTSWYAQ